MAAQLYSYINKDNQVSGFERVLSKKQSHQIIWADVLIWRAKLWSTLWNLWSDSAGVRLITIIS